MTDFVVNATKVSVSRTTEHGTITADIIKNQNSSTGVESGFVLDPHGTQIASFSFNGNDMSLYFDNGTPRETREPLYLEIEAFIADATAHFSA